MTALRATLPLVLCTGLLLAIDAAEAAVSGSVPASPYAILGVSLRSPPLDAMGACLEARDTRREALEDVEVAEADSSARAGEREEARRLRAAILAAREPEAGLGAWERLTASVAEAGPSTLAACAWLERARLELKIGRVPEARLSAARALRVFDEDGAPRSIQRAVDFYRAESFARAGDEASSIAIHERLAAEPDAVGRAAAVRLADARWTREPSHAHRIELERAVEKSEMAAAPVWAPRLSEIAIADDDAAAARRWLEVARGGEGRRTQELEAAMTVRRADLLFLDGSRASREQGREMLRELADGGRSVPIQRLALVREIQLGKRLTDGARRRLERTLRVGSPRLQAYAAHVLAGSLVATSDFASALDVMVELVHLKAHAPPQSLDPGSFDAILAGIFASGSCDEWIETVGGRRDLLLRHASEPGPFLRLGDCYLEAGLAHSALETFRGVAKSFGPTSIQALTLRSAQAEYAMGRLTTARAAARANVRAGTEPKDGWRVLYARLELEDGRPDVARKTLRPLLERIARSSTDAWAPEDREAILLSAQAAMTDGTPDDLALLARALARPLEKKERVGILAEASILAADLHRQSGRPEVARSLYERTLPELEAGLLRSRSAYWLGVLSSDPDEARAFWSRVADDDDPWARMAANEVALAEGRAAVGAPLEVPAPRLPAAVEGVQP